jgi:hypothetical protein
MGKLVRVNGEVEDHSNVLKLLLWVSCIYLVGLICEPQRHKKFRTQGTSRYCKAKSLMVQKT